MNAAESIPRLPEPLANFVARELTRAIELGHYQPGQRLVEAEIAARFGLSRAPVREALRMLTTDELVVQRPRRGTVVRDLSPAEISEMFELRSALYAAVVRLFVRRATSTELDGLAALIQRIIDLARNVSITPAEFVAATQASSTFLIARCGNRRLEEYFEKLTRQSYRYYAELAHSTVASRQHLSESVAQMLQAARAGDAEAASMCAWRLHESIHAAARAAVAAKAEPEPEPEPA